MMSAQLRAFLFLIRWCEGTSDDGGYSRIVGGSSFGNWDDHPRIVKSGVFSNGKAWQSSAAGAYQFLATTWDECKAALDLPDFSPESQDRAAVYLIQRRGALHAVEEGNLDQAISICNKEWASLPGAPYGQPKKSLDACKVIFERAGGTLMQATGITPVPSVSPAPPPEPGSPAPIKETIMAIPALVTAAASALLPIVADLFRARGSKTANRNAEIVDQIGEAAPTIIAIAKEVAGGGNEQTAVEAILADKALQQQFRAAVALQWSDIEPFLRHDAEEREKARGFIERVTSTDGPTWRQVGAGILISLLALVVIVGGGWMLREVLSSAEHDQQTKGMIIGFLIAAATQVLSFFFGSSASSRTKDQTIADQARPR